MPFDLLKPKAQQPYEHLHGRRRRYWPYKKSIENMAYTPQEIMSWGSISKIPESERTKSTIHVPVRKCENKCPDPPPKFSPERYLQDKLMLENPALLTAIKNTPIMRMQETTNNEIEFVQPHFTHKAIRSQFHLLVPQNYRTALCTITDNLYRDHETEKQDLVSRKGRDVAAKEVLSIPSKSDTSLRSQPNRVSSRPSFHKRRRNAESLTKIAKTEGLLNYIRRKVNKELEAEELQKMDRRFFHSEVAFDKSFRTKEKPKKGKYTWEKHGGMQSLCMDYPGVSLFNESPSDVCQASSPSDQFKELTKGAAAKEEMRKSLSPDLLQLLLNAPSTKAFSSSQEPCNAFDHCGLLESAKAESLESYLKKLYRRERTKVNIPRPLLENVYGRVKGVPKNYEYKKSRLPAHLEENCPPFPEELEKVERAMKNEKLLRKERRAKGIMSQNEVTKVIEQFAKPTIESQHTITPVGADKSKSIMTLDDYPKIYNEQNKRDSSDSLFCQVGFVKLENAMEKMLRPGEVPKTIRRSRISGQDLDTIADILSGKAERSSKSKKPSNLKKSAAARIRKDLEGNVKPQRTTSDLFTTSSEDLEEEEAEAEEEDEDEEEESQEANIYGVSETRGGIPIDGVDSRENLPYPDVTFSSICLPDGVPGIDDNWLYQKLAEDQRSLSSTESRNTDFFEDDIIDIEGLSVTEVEATEEEEMENKIHSEASETAIMLDSIFEKFKPHFSTNVETVRLSITDEEQANSDDNGPTE